MNEIVVSTSSFDLDNNPAIAQLREAGLKVTGNPFGRKLTAAEISELLNDSVIGLLAGVEPLTADVIGGAKSLAVISRLGVGLDNVDQAAAKAHGVQVFSTPDAPVDSVAEMTLGLMLATLRQLPQADRQVRNGDWPRLKGHLLKAQTVGILGMGRIGAAVARLCSAFGARVLAHDPVVRDDPSVAEWLELAELFAQADVLSLHAPYGEATHHIINRQNLAAMKPGAILINTARGNLIDEVALLEALANGQLAGAGLDVFETEPYTGPLQQLPQVVLTPHLASSAIEARRTMELEAASNLYQALCEAGKIADGGS